MDGEDAAVRELDVRQEALVAADQPAFEVETVDTTGAGDRLLSVFLETVDQEAAIWDALRQALEAVERAIEEGDL